MNTTIKDRIESRQLDLHLIKCNAGVLHGSKATTEASENWKTTVNGFLNDCIGTKRKGFIKNKYEIRIFRGISRQMSIFKGTFENFQTRLKIHTASFSANR
jgi:hypothetical protein